MSTIKGQIAIAFLVCLAVTPVTAQVAQEGSVEDLGVEAAWPEAPDGTVVWSSQVIQRPGARFLRLEFVVEGELDDPDLAYMVRVIDPDGHQPLEIPGDRLDNGAPFWTPPVPNGVMVQVLSSRAPTGLTFTISRVARQEESAVVLSVSGPDQREPISAAEPVFREVARAVAKLSFIVRDPVDGSEKLRACTGFLVASNLLLTNNHCVASETVCGTTVALFDYEEGPAGVRFGVPHRCRRVVATHEGLDASLLELEGNPGVAMGIVKVSPRSLSRGEPLVIVQHPGGRPKQMSRVECSVTEPVAVGFSGPVDFGHQCDTEGGSSGSPVFDGDRIVVGLHHLGFSTSGPWTATNRAVRAESFNTWLSEHGVITSRIEDSSITRDE